MNYEHGLAKLPVVGNDQGTAVEVGFKDKGSITIKRNGPVTVLPPHHRAASGRGG